jgi:hypothetical protein
MKVLRPLPLLLVTILIAQAQTVRLTPFPSKLITVASYDDKLHWWTFPDAVRDAAMKPFAIVVTNSTDMPVIAAHVQWNWISADGKPHTLVQEHNGLSVPYASIVKAKSVSLILPNGVVIQKGSRPIPFLKRSQRSATATDIHVSLDAIVLADGQVIGPDKNHLIADLQGEAEAAATMKTIINAAKTQGRDPQPDIEKAIADEPRGSATGRWLVEFMHSSKMGSRWQVPSQIELPHFYRKSN